ncbi:MAG: hypothetical protein HYV17_11690 [Xanthomonadales bacterium]|nr:hypothetical protein [Xanthomonadales bacterium]
MFKDVHAYLVDKVDRGLIEVRFSCMNVYEALPLVKAAAEPAALRLATIKQLCGKKCLTEFSQLLKYELEPDGAARAGGVLVDNGMWHPDPGEIRIPDTLQLLRERARNAGGNRKQRRARGAGSKAQIVGSLRELLGSTSDDQLALRAFRHPVTASAARTLRRYLYGEATRAQLQSALRESLSDLECWIRWYQLNWDQAVAGAIALREKGDALKEMLFANIQRMQQSGRELNDIGYPEQRKKLLVNQLVKTHRSDFPDVFLGLLRQQFSMEASGNDSWASCPGILLMTKLVGEMSLQTAILDTNIRQPRQSDLGDVLHALYAPYVDIFRADGAMTSMIAAINPPIPTKFVGKLEELPRQIEAHPKFRVASV